MPVVMIQACTWMPCACAASINDWSGSNGAGETPATVVRGRLERLQKQSPRRTTCATIAFMLAAVTSATSWSI